MVVKQIYSLIEYDEAVNTMEAGADNIGLVPMQNGGVPAHRVPIERVHRIFDECKRRGVTSVAIMLTNDPDEMIDLAKKSSRTSCTSPETDTPRMRPSRHD